MSILEKTLRGAVLAGIFALPLVALIVADSLFFPYITGKNFAFRLIVELSAGAWLSLALVFPRYRPRRGWILGAFALLVLVMAVADVQGVVPFKSFWSNYERMDGWITLAHLLLYLTLAYSMLDTEKLWRRLFQWSLGISVFLSVLGFMQVAGVAAFGGSQGNLGLSGRIDATFGNPIYLAVYMFFHIFLAALLWAQARAEKPRGGFVPIFYGGAIFVDALALLFTGTRGTILGLLGGACLALLLYVISVDGTPLRKWAIGGFAALAVFAALLVGAKNTHFVRAVGFLDRLATISLSDATIKSRFLNIGIAWQGVKERPLLGWGQENYAIVFDKYYDPRMYAQEQWFDRVHNSIFDWLIAGGILGLLAYVSVFAAALWVLWRRETFSALERSILTGLLAGYFVHNLAAFDNITSYILFATVLGYLAYRAASDSSAPPLVARELFSPRLLPVASVVALVAAGGIAWGLNAKAFAANRTLISAISAQHEGTPEDLALFEKAISYGTYGTQEAREQLMQTTGRVLQSKKVSDDLKRRYVEEAARQLDLQALASQEDARFPLFSGYILDAYGDYEDAFPRLVKAHELSPRKQTILFELGQNALSRGDRAAALGYFEEAYRLDTDDRQALFLYASTLIRAKEDAKAEELLAPLVKTGEAADGNVTAAYVARGRYDKIIEIWQAHVAADPGDADGYFTLAAAYYQGGQSERALAVLRQAEERFPELAPQVEETIRAVQSGQ